MWKIDKKHYLVAGLTTAFISFILILVGIKFVLGNEINTSNIVAFISFSVLVGILTSLLVLFKLRIAYTSFMVGLAFGFFEMYRAFLNGMSGWGDLVGLISMFMWTIVGLGVGIIAQLGYYLFKKHKKI